MQTAYKNLTLFRVDQWHFPVSLCGHSGVINVETAKNKIKKRKRERESERENEREKEKNKFIRIVRWNFGIPRSACSGIAITIVTFGEVDNVAQCNDFAAATSAGSASASTDDPCVSTGTTEPITHRHNNTQRE